MFNEICCFFYERNIKGDDDYRSAFNSENIAARLDNKYLHIGNIPHKQIDIEAERIDYTTSTKVKGQRLYTAYRFASVKIDLYIS